MYQLVNVITCEITNPASPNSVCGYFMGFNETIDSLRDSIKFKRAYKAPGGALVHKCLTCEIIYWMQEVLFGSSWHPFPFSICVYCLAEVLHHCKMLSDTTHCYFCNINCQRELFQIRTNRWSFWKELPPELWAWYCHKKVWIMCHQLLDIMT